MRDSFALHRRCGKSGIVENSQETCDCCHHRNQTKILWREQASQNHDRDQIQGNLNALGENCDESARDCAALEVREQMLSCKVLLVVVAVLGTRALISRLTRYTSGFRGCIGHSVFIRDGALDRHVGIRQL